MGGFNFPGFEQGVFQFENVNPVYNNPGGIQANQPIAATFGAINAGSSGLAKFPSLDTGINAFENSPTVQAFQNGNMSLSDFINTWSPPSAGNLNNANYIQTVQNAMNNQNAPQTGSDIPLSTQTSIPSNNTLIASTAGASGTNIAPDTNPSFFSLLKDPIKQGGGLIAALLIGVAVIIAGVWMLKPAIPEKIIGAVAA